ncbi:YibL family ribosome-associated protein [Thaumasiovibrio subtropicus]|uniref:YibL family ribosome-associated protein n=1 Tax=Thaumasiovibrio subtropicus TaxID=1891207 RepID=UPI000B360F37|nr:YibL family ribosome-associated protein [Thaumasiovibrio subtropicus]
MSMKNEMQKQRNRLENCKRKLAAARARGDQPIVTQFVEEIAKIEKRLAQMNHKQSFDLNKERKSLMDMAFSREITKAEQADLGKLKKSVRGLVIVHPMTKLGKELRLEVMTGYAPKAF